MEASFIGVARIGGAWVIVITGISAGRETLAQRAVIPGGAGIIVIAVAGEGNVCAAASVLALIKAARVFIIAVKGNPADALAANALVFGGAGVAIIARAVIGCVGTALNRVAGVIGALVAISAVHCSSRMALSRQAVVLGST